MVFPEQLDYNGYDTNLYNKTTDKLSIMGLTSFSLTSFM